MYRKTVRSDRSSGIRKRSQGVRWAKLLEQGQLRVIGIYRQQSCPVAAKHAILMQAVLVARCRRVSRYCHAFLKDSARILQKHGKSGVTTPTTSWLYTVFCNCA